MKKNRFLLAILIIALLMTTPLVASATTQAAPSIWGVAAGTTDGPYVSLFWNPVSGAQGYDIFRSTSAGGTYVQLNPSTKVTSNAYTDRSIAKGTTYYYKVRAYHSHLFWIDRSAFSNVTAACWVRVTSVSVTPSAVLMAGRTVQLSAAVTPANANDRRLSWSISNAAIATISQSGVVTGVAPGSATVTVRSLDTGRTATTAVTVLNRITDPVVFIKQSTSYTCTLASITMALRRNAILNGNAGWQSITESSVRPYGWIEGTGLRGEFSYGGMNVGYGYLSGTVAQKKSAMISLLAQNPEGIEIYDTSKPHAVLLTDYDAATGTFYIADPAGSIVGRTPLANSTATGSGQDGKISSLSKYWYVK